MKYVLNFLLCVIVFVSCEKAPVFSSSRAAQTIQIEQTDDEIIQITQNARNTLPIFFRHLAVNGKGEHNFCIKCPLAADNGGSIITEQVWLSDIRFKNGVYSGKLANNPVYLHGMKKGDTVIFNADSISDWMYTQDEKIIGGYSIRYLLEKIPEDQRGGELQKLLGMFSYQ